MIAKEWPHVAVACLGVPSGSLAEVLKIEKRSVSGRDPETINDPGPLDKLETGDWAWVVMQPDPDRMESERDRLNVNMVRISTK